ACERVGRRTDRRFLRGRGDRDRRRRELSTRVLGERRGMRRLMGVSRAGARVLLTGASGGVGQAIARRLSRERAQLVLSGRRADVLEALAGELGARALVADLARREEVVGLLASVGEIDVLVANAALPGS